MPRVTKITIARLFNLGSYEHVRYEVSAEIDPGDSAQDVLIGLEKIVEALKPESQCGVPTESELHREALRLAAMRDEVLKLSEDEFRRKHGFFEGTPLDYVARCETSQVEHVGKRAAYVARATKARALLDALGGSSKWKDCKLDWEYDDEDEL